MRKYFCRFHYTTAEPIYITFGIQIPDIQIYEREHRLHLIAKKKQM